MEAKKFGIFLTEIRKEKGMTQAELAEKLNVTDKAISRWERGVGLPDIQMIEPLAEVLEVSVLEIMRGERIESQEITNTEVFKETIELTKSQKQSEAQIAGISFAVVILVYFLIKLYNRNPAELGGGTFSIMFFFAFSIGSGILGIWIEKHAYLLSLVSWLCCAMALLQNLHMNVYFTHYEDWSALMDTVGAVEGLGRWMITGVFVVNAVCWISHKKRSRMNQSS